MPFVGHHASGPWKVPIPLSLILLLVAFLYLRGCAKLRSATTAIPAWRTASFLLGVALVWVALGSPLAALDEQFLTAHMLKHLFLMTIAPALILLGAPVMPLLRGIPQRLLENILRPASQFSPLRLLGRVLANPVVCWLAAAAALVAWHIPEIFALTLTSPGLHHLEHFTFVAAGFLFWWPVIQPLPTAPALPEWPMLLYLFLATLPCDILSAYLTFCDRVVYPTYLAVSHRSENFVLQDQQLAGALMWTCITIIYLAPAVALTVQLLQAPPQQEILGRVEQESSHSSPESSRTI